MSSIEEREFGTVKTPKGSDDSVKVTLEAAREKFGTTNQILVCLEELCELACVIAKFPRYESADKAREDLHERAVDEIADVFIILDHVQEIMHVSDEEVRERIHIKAPRVARWLKGNSMQQTIEDRDLNT